MTGPGAVNDMAVARRDWRGTLWELPAPGAFVAVCLALSMAGVLSLWFMTPWGIGTSPDSIGYLQAARSLVARGGEAIGRGDTTSAAALTHFAPLYSFLLASGGLVGLDPLEWARWLNALLFGANLLTFSVMLRRALGGTGWMWVLGIVVILASVPMLTVHVTMLSEPAFILLTCLGLLLLASYLGSSVRLHLLLAALAIGLAWLARYAGAASVITGGLALLMFGGRRPGRRVWDALLFGAVSSAGMLAWLVRNAMVANSATGRELVFHPIDRGHIWQAVYTASGWLMIPASAPDWVRLVAWGTLLAIAIGVLVAMKRAPAARNGGTAVGRSASDAPILVRLLALFVVTYLAFLAVSISFFDANTPLDDRILSPVHVTGAIIGLWLVHALWTVLSPRPVLRRLLVIGLVGLTGAQVVQAARLVAASHQRGWGFSSAAWHASPTLDRVRRLPGAARIFSNVPELVYLHAGREAEVLPRRWLPMDRRPNPDFPVQMAALEHALTGESAVVVLFTGLRLAPSAWSERDLTSELPLLGRDQQLDGVILCAVVCPE